MSAMRMPLKQKSGNGISHIEDDGEELDFNTNIEDLVEDDKEDCATLIKLDEDIMIKEPDIIDSELDGSIEHLDLNTMMDEGSDY
jgi:hypothetical protein